MKVLVNEANYVYTIIYDESGCLKTLNYIDIPEGIELVPGKHYVYENKKFREIDILDDKNKKYLEADAKDRYKSEIKLLQKYLSDTDYITNKFNELVLMTNEMTNYEFTNKYGDILEKRVSSRKRINELEDLLSNLAK